MDVILFALNLAWKILAICLGWMLFKYVLKNGSGTFKEILDTISVALRTFGHWIRKICLNYLRKESAEAEGEPEFVKEVAPEDPEKDDEPKFVFMSFEDFQRAVKNHDKITLD